VRSALISLPHLHAQLGVEVGGEAAHPSGNTPDRAPERGRGDGCLLAAESSRGLRAKKMGDGRAAWRPDPAPGGRFRNCELAQMQGKAIFVDASWGVIKRAVVLETPWRCRVLGIEESLKAGARWKDRQPLMGRRPAIR